MGAYQLSSDMNVIAFCAIDSNARCTRARRRPILDITPAFNTWRENSEYVAKKFIGFDPRNHGYGYFFKQHQRRGVGIDE
jgi:hypothetical protein